MRKLISVFSLGAALTIVLSSCGSSADETPTPAPATATVSVPTPTVTPNATADPNAQFLKKFGYQWKTNFSKKSIELDEVVLGGPPRDGIPPLDQPRFTTIESASEWLKDQEPVLVYANNGDTKAYPLQILMWHEIVNDVVGGKPVAATYSPLCNISVILERTLDGDTLRFGTTGLLRSSNLVMWDSQTESWWQQATGTSIVGANNGKKLESQGSQIVSFGDFKASFPSGKVLSRLTGFDRKYGTNIYGSYDSGKPLSVLSKPDERLPAMERVLGVSIDGVKQAYSFSTLTNRKAVNEKLNSADVVVFWKSGAVSATDNAVIADSKNVGAAMAFSPMLNGQKLTFDARDELFTDRETGSEWNIFGVSVSGPMKGSQLKQLNAINSFWFAWAAFNPETTIYSE